MTNMRTRRLLALLLALALVLSVSLPVWADDATWPFTDVTEDDAYYEAVDFVWENGLFEGVGNGHFDPTGTMTRAMAVMVFYRMCGLPELDETQETETFSDVREGAWYEDAVTWACQSGLIQGYGDGTFGPRDNVTLEHVLTMLYRLCGSPLAGEDLGLELDSDADTERVEALVWALSWYLSDENIERIETPATRAEVADVLQTYYVHFTTREDAIQWYNPEVEGAMASVDPIAPQENFAAAVNGPKNARIELGSTLMSVSYIDDVVTEVTLRLYDLVSGETSDTPEEEMIHNFYQLAIDWDARNEIGLTPLAETLDWICETETIEELTEKFVGDGEHGDLGSLFTRGVGIDLDDSSICLLHIAPVSLTLGDAAEYTQMSAYGQALQTANDAKVQYLLDRLGFSDEDIDGILSDCLSYETEMASHMLTTAERSASDYVTRINNKMSIEEIEALSPNMPIADWIRTKKLDSYPVYVVQEPAWLEAANAYFTQEHLDEMLSYLCVTACLNLIEMLDEDAYLYSEQIGAAIYGIEPSADDLHRGMYAVRTYLPGPLSKVYTDTYCTPEMKEKVTALCEDIRDSWREKLSNIEWIGEETRTKAIEKLDAITVQAVYPDTWQDWSTLEIVSKEDGGSYLDAIAAVASYNMDNLFSQIGHEPEIDLNTWYDVSAAYFNNYNRLYVFAGILTEDMYTDNMSYEDLLGGIGFIIAHEFSHAFDSLGSQFDKDGNMLSWWDEDDYATFVSRTERVVEFLNRIEVFPGTYLNGDQVAVETIADMGSVACLLHMVSDQADFDYAAFFERLADVWGMVGTQSYLNYLLAVDSHAPRWVRVNVAVMQFDEFRDTYDVQPGDGMYLAPEDVIAVW